MSITTTLDLESRLSERVRVVPPSGIRRFFEIAATMDDVISLGIGEPDFVTPRPVIDMGFRLTCEWGNSVIVFACFSVRVHSTKTR